MPIDNLKLPKLRPTQILALGFAFIILLGSLLLSLPISTPDRRPLPYMNALFTATSATCVTGLTVYDIFTTFSFFGQMVILLLIQIGGLGFMGVAMLFSLALGRRIGLRERSLLVEALSANKLGGIVRIVRRMLIGTAVLEIGGALILAGRFVPHFGLARGFWFAFFHAISAFCNAGFDLMGALEPNSSLTLFNRDPVVLVTLAVLIIVGGIGFIVWSDLLEHRFKLNKLNLHSRLTLMVTAGLILFSSILLLVLESRASLAGMPTGQKVLNAFFMSVSPRTAGFASVDLGQMQEASNLFTILLMMIGAAPGGTGGGIKITTALILVSAIYSGFRQREVINLLHHRISNETMRRAFIMTVLYFGLVILGTFFLCLDGQTLAPALYECTSAISTTGLSLGITPGLGMVSKVALILLMYMGRLGSLTVFMAVTRISYSTKLKDPVGRVIVG